MASRRQEIEAEIRKLQEEMDSLDTRPEEVFDDGAILYWEKRFRSRGRQPKDPFRYCALRARGLWFATGHLHPRGMSWDELVDFMEQGAQADQVIQVYLAQELEPAFEVTI